MKKCLYILILSMVSNIGYSVDKNSFPDLGGIVDLSEPNKIADRLFILTNPKSGSHLLIYSIMKLTQRPMRGRTELSRFLHDRAYFEPENVMQYPLDFTKPTTYWGHEYTILRRLNGNRNKLIFISRDYKENLISQILVEKKLLPAEEHREELEYALLEEVFRVGPVFKDIIGRLNTFDQWDPHYRCVVPFEDLIYHPDYFIPKVLEFIGEDCPYEEFVANYDLFKRELLQRYRMRDNGTGSGENLQFFRQFVSSEVLQKIDAHVQHIYPIFWDRYLKQYTELQ